MARMYGRAPKGERCRAPVPHGHWKTTTFVGALRLSGVAAPMTLDGAMNAAAFLAYVEQVLVPTLKPGDVVVMGPSGNAAGGTTFQPTRRRPHAPPSRRPGRS